jgi:hypothetical protein
VEGEESYLFWGHSAIPNHIIRPVSRRAYKNENDGEMKIMVKMKSTHHWIFNKLGHMIPLWKGKNPIYFGVIKSKVKVTITINRILMKIVVKMKIMMKKKIMMEMKIMMKMKIMVKMKIKMTRNVCITKYARLYKSNGIMAPLFSISSLFSISPLFSILSLFSFSP